MQSVFAKLANNWDSDYSLFKFIFHANINLKSRIRLMPCWPLCSVKLINFSPLRSPTITQSVIPLYWSRATTLPDNYHVTRSHAITLGLVHSEPEKFKNEITVHFGFVFEGTSAREITWLSWCHSFHSKGFPSTPNPISRSFQIGLITVSGAILTGSQGGQKLQCLYGNSMANNFFPKLNFTQFMNGNIKILRRRLYPPSLKNVGWIEDAQLIF